MTSQQYKEKLRDKLFPLKKYMKRGYVGKGGVLQFKKWYLVTREERRLMCILSSYLPSITYGLFLGTGDCFVNSAAFITNDITTPNQIKREIGLFAV